MQSRADDDRPLKNLQIIWAKVPILRHLLTTNPDLLRRCIIFVETMEYGRDHVMPLLMELGGDYRTQWHHYFADADANQLDAFRKGELECLITCKNSTKAWTYPASQPSS